MRISVINQSRAVSNLEALAAIRVVNRQLQEDFRGHWHRDASLRFEGTVVMAGDPSALDHRGDAAICLADHPEADMSGYEGRAIPFGLVFTTLAQMLGEPWSVALSREALALAADPEASLFARGPHPDDPSRGVYHWYEVCDAVQDETYLIEGIAVSNFLLPAYFAEREEAGSPRDFLSAHGAAEAPLRSFGLKPGGHQGFFDPQVRDHVVHMIPGDERAAIRARLTLQSKWASRGLRRQAGVSPLAPAPGRPHTKSHERPKVREVDIHEPRFELISVELETAAARDDVKARALAMLGSSWSASDVPEAPRSDEGKPGRIRADEIDFVHSSPHTLSTGEIWEISYRLAALAGVVWAEPSFEVDVAPGGAPLAHSAHHADTEDERWSLRLVGALGTWQTYPNAKGKGIIIGHLDTGLLNHPELDAKRVTGFAVDLLDADRYDMGATGGHGLSTGSVMTASAPEARLLPIRVTRPLVLPPPVLLRVSMSRLRDGLRYAVATGCRVVAISFGGLPFPFRGLHKAIGEAVNAGVIVLAAAGNREDVALDWLGQGSVLWPARYPEVIAVAGCDVARSAWPASARGPEVDVAAPAESVWSAAPDGKIGRESGTSFAVAMVAGLAAGWLSHHGVDNLDRRLGRANVATAFRRLLREHSDPAGALPEDQFGGGVVNAPRVFAVSIDTLVERAGAPRRARALRAAREDLTDLVSKVAPEELRRVLVPGAAVPDEDLELVAHEAIFHLTTSSAFRRAILAALPRAGAQGARRAPLDLPTRSRYSPTLLRLCETERARA